MSDNPLKIIGEVLKPLEKPAIALIEKIASAGYILYEPHHIKAIAKAQAKAAKIEAESEIEVNDVHRRAVIRWIEEEAQHQKNIEDITTKSINKLNEDANPDVMNNDWITKFFDKCRLVSDDKMQDLWANILSGEANKVGSYSPKALTIMADMDQKIATLFNTFCSLCIVQLEDFNAYLNSPDNFKIKDASVPILTGSINDVSTGVASNSQFNQYISKSKSLYEMYGFSFNEFYLLLEYGLIDDELNMSYLNFWHNNEIFGIFKQSATEPYNQEDYKSITIAGYHLTAIGRELFHITKRDVAQDYIRQLGNFLQELYEVKIVKHR